MSVSIGESLGTVLALFEQELRENPDDMAMLSRIWKISEIYRNFSENDFQGFKADFESGYKAGQEFNLSETGAEVSEIKSDGPAVPIFD